MLRKKTNSVSKRAGRTSILGEVSNKSVDRRSFLRGSGLAIGGLAAISATGGTVTHIINTDYCQRFIDENLDV